MLLSTEMRCYPGLKCVYCAPRVAKNKVPPLRLLSPSHPPHELNTQEATVSAQGKAAACALLRGAIFCTHATLSADVQSLVDLVSRQGRL